MRTILLLGPDLNAVSGISTHLNQLLGSEVARRFRTLHFQVGSEGRTESRAAKLWRALVSPLQLLWLLLRHRPEIVHINTAMEPKAFWRDLVYLLIARACGRRIVYQVHGGMLPEEFARGSALRARFLRWVLGMPDLVVLLAQVELRAYRAFMPGLPAVVIANAIDTGWAGVRADAGDDDGAGTRADAGAHGAVTGAGRARDVLRLVYLGRLVAVKGLFESIEAVALLRDAGIPVRLEIAGNGPDEAALRARADALGLHDEVVFRGAVFGADKERLWLQADVLVFPTYHREGLPYALLEAMAAGVVPVTCPVGAIPDVIEDRRDGLLVPPRDPAAVAAAIRWLADHRQAAGAIARAARQRVGRDYCVERLAADFCGVYSRL